MHKTLTDSNTYQQENQAFPFARTSNCVIIEQSEVCEENVPTISEKSVLKSDEDNIYLGNTAHEIADTLFRMSNRAYEKFFASMRGKELLSKADKYHIPYNKDAIDWSSLIDEISYYEMLLEDADNLHIEWDMSEYDPVALAQEIEYHERRESEQKRMLRSIFFNTRGLEV